VGLLGAMVKGVVAKRLYDEARKPHNQERMRSAYHRVTGKGGPGSGGQGGPGTGVDRGPGADGDRGPGTGVDRGPGAAPG
jgi:hypothetical protein